MIKKLLISVGALVFLIVLGSVRTVLAVSSDFTVGDFENMQYVDYTNANFNNTVSQGWINNGPTAPLGTGTSSDSNNPPDQNAPPTGSGYNQPTVGPSEPGGSPNGELNGNWNQIYNTGWDSWYGSASTNQLTVYSNSTTTGVTHGTTAIKVNPNAFGTNNTLEQGLALKVQNIGQAPNNNTGILTSQTAQSYATNQAFITHKYVAIDVTFKTSDWAYTTLTGTGAVGAGGGTNGQGNGPGTVQLQLWSNLGGGTSTTPLVDRFGFHPLGNYIENPNYPTSTYTMARTPTVDSRQSLLGGTGGVWYPGLSNATTGTYTTTLYYDYSHWQAAPDNADSTTGPPTGVFYDERSFATNGITGENDGTGTGAGVSGSGAYLEFMMESNIDSGYTAGDWYVDNFRFTNSILKLGDFNNDGHVDAKDIAAMQAALTNTAGYEANPTGLSGQTLSAQDMLTIGDVNGDGKFNNADLQALILDLKSGKGSVATVPEPTSLVLLGLTVPVMGFVARKSRRRKAA